MSSWAGAALRILMVYPDGNICFSVALCGVSFSDPEGYIDSSDFPPQPSSNFLECTYNVTVYTGYGVELQVA